MGLKINFLGSMKGRSYVPQSEPNPFAGQYVSVDDKNLAKLERHMDDLVTSEVNKMAGELTRLQAARIGAAIKRLGHTETKSMFQVINFILRANTEGNISSGDLAEYKEMPATANASFNFPFPTRGQLVWARHAPLTPKLKQADSYRRGSGVKRDSVDKYMYRTGRLRKFFRDKASMFSQKLGTPRITYSDAKGRRVSAKRPKQSVVTVKIAFMPNVQKRTLPGYLSADWGYVDFDQTFEKWLIQDDDILTKLYGSWQSTDEEGLGIKGGSNRRTQRPLVQPVVNYFLLYRLPQLAGSIISREMKRKRHSSALNSQWGV
jgi:hypothetical protein